MPKSQSNLLPLPTIIEPNPMSASKGSKSSS